MTSTQVTIEVKLTEQQYEYYLFMKSALGYSWFEAIGEIFGIDPDGDFTIKSAGTSSNPENGLIVVFYTEVK